MKQESKKISLYKKIRRGLYIQVAEGERRSKLRLAACAIAILLIASVLLFTATIMETSRGSQKYVYRFGDGEQKLNSDLAVSGNIQYIDLNALADYANISTNSFFSSMTYRINSTEASFTDNSDIATVNGIEIKMSSKAIIKNGYCLVPISAVEEIFSGIDISTEEKQTNITLNGKNIYMTARTEPNIEYETDISAYLPYINSKDEYIFILANKENPLGENFAPADLSEIPEEYRKDTEIFLYSVAEKALEAMMQDMRALGFDDIYVTSAYRKYSSQEWLFNYYINKEMENGLSYDEAVEKVLTYSSEPGKSEHQTGLCVDFMTYAMKELENYGYEGNYPDDIGFAETDAYAWLLENCWKYGFVLRYPQDKVAITGYSYESWHYRFVGLETASIMHQTGLCYEEYLENFK